MSRLPDSLQAECEQVSSGAEPSCPWASRRPGMGLQGTGCQSTRPGRGGQVLTGPRKEHFIKADSGEM